VVEVSERVKVLEPIDEARRQYVQSKLAYAKETLANLPPDATLMRINLESHVVADEEELRTGMRVHWRTVKP